MEHEFSENQIVIYKSENGQTQKEAVKISTEEFLKIINEMKSEFASDVFANPKEMELMKQIVVSTLNKGTKNYN